MAEVRWRNEQQFHDRQASERSLALHPQDYFFTDESYLSHESWIAPSFAALGELRDMRVLDLGCGHGMASVVVIPTVALRDFGISDDLAAALDSGR